MSLELDGELPELERVLLAAHLASCASCRAFAGALARLTGELREHPLEQPSRVLAPAAVRRLRVRIAPLATLAAAAVASIVLGLASAAGRGGAPVPGGYQIGLPPVQSSLLVALRDEQSHSARRFRDAVRRRPQTHWWRGVYGGKPVAS